MNLNVRVVRTILLVVSAWVVLIFFEVLGNRTFQQNRCFAEMLSAVGPLLFYLAYLKFAKHKVQFPTLSMPRWLPVACPILFAIASWLSREFNGTIDFYPTMKIATACLCIGLAEESLFRGTMFLGFQGYRPAVYLFASAALFAFTHISFTPIAILNILVAGLAYGLARIAGTPFLALVAIHAIHDLAFLMPGTQFNGLQQYVFWPATIFTLAVTVWYVCSTGSWNFVPRVLKTSAKAD